MKFNPFHKKNEVDDVAMAFGISYKHILHIYRSNGEEVEVDTVKKNATHQLSFRELEAIEKQYPYLSIYTFKLIKKIY